MGCVVVVFFFGGGGQAGAEDCRDPTGRKLS